MRARNAQWPAMARADPKRRSHNPLRQSPPCMRHGPQRWCSGRGRGAGKMKNIILNFFFNYYFFGVLIKFKKINFYFNF